ncbi:glycoside hydrolase [Desulfobacterota bacterium AH_259_B03_O07]|nr:glycoside hydrolase [Desulfobacterota bacterium AH_259_B03_O07]
MNDDLNGLIEQAKRVLDGNWLGKSTKPSPHLYPHQWNWDSGFISIGYASYNQKRAQQELSTLFNAQWKNGMVPQIIFNPDALGGYFPEPDFWQCERSPNYPKGVLTSGITMPPVHAVAALRTFNKATDKAAAKGWLREIYPKILESHEYLYRERDPLKEGLIYIRHPWESGLDNSPTWDDPLKAMKIDRDKLPPYERKDLKKGIPASQRPTDFDYDRYVFLVDLFRRLKYDEHAIYQECPFLIQDPLFNGILSKADEDLVEMGKVLGEDTKKIEEWHQQTNRSIRNKMWHELHGAFDVFDMRANEHVGTITASGFLPLLCGAPTQEEAQIMYDFLDSNSFCPMHDATCFSIPNYNLEGDYIDTKNYWRGPVWINTNWLLMDGLRRYGFNEKADNVKHDIVDIVRLWGFHEYFDPFKEKGIGYGTDNFSWTSALFIDAASELLESQ